MFFFILLREGLPAADPLSVSGSDWLWEEMNFSLYRGNLHKVPDVPRRWPFPKPSMSLQVFQKAIAKRDEALHRLTQIDNGQKSGEEGGNPEPHGAINGGDVDMDTRDEEDVRINESRKRKRDDSDVPEAMLDDADVKTAEKSCKTEEIDPDLCSTEAMMIDNEKIENMDMDQQPDTPLLAHHVLEKAENCDQAEDQNASSDKNAESNRVNENGGSVVRECEKLEDGPGKLEDHGKPTEQVMQKQEVCVTALTTEVPGEDMKSKKKAELGLKLKQLQETKHQLVQILKQVLMNEEESKRRGQNVPQVSAPYLIVGMPDQSMEQKVASDLEEGELEYTRNNGSLLSPPSHVPVGHAPPMGTVGVGRQSTISQHQRN